MELGKCIPCYQRVLLEYLNFKLYSVHLDSKPELKSIEELEPIEEIEQLMAEPAHYPVSFYKEG